MKFTDATSSFSQSLSKGLFIIALAILSLTPLSLPLAVSAEDCQPPSGGTGVTRPVGADAPLYTYDCNTGQWYSSHFVYNPGTGIYSPLDTPVYTYNSSTGKYDYQVWVFSAPKADYVASFLSVNSPPAGAQVIGGPPAPTAPLQNIANTGSGSNNSVNGSGAGSISNTGPKSNNQLNSGGQGNLSVNNGNTLSVGNLINQDANSGNAVVIGNTSAGSALSGDATNMLTMLNMLQSASSQLGSGNVVTFVQDINGDLTGDLMLDPSLLSSVQAAGAPAGPNNQLMLNNTTEAAINNEITLNSVSGNAGVSLNTSAGDATSGSAKAVANIINMINSAVASGKSFIGTININGNFNGDILLPANFVDQLIAANVPQVTIYTTGPNSNNTVNNSGGGSTTVNNSDNQGINNSVNATATSGSASVANNTAAGSATSGTSSNSITAFNLTGSNTVGKNSILVFVNVLGKWVGLIVNTPPGTTVAQLGGGITQTGPNSNNTINSGGTTDQTINNMVNQQINNTINVNARSGDANVSSNTTAGSARSGDAQTAVNLLNMSNSSLSLTDWFGILFINVFGTWNGSFGVNTSAGDPVIAGLGAGSGSGYQLFAFVPGGVGSNKSYIVPSGGWHSASSGNSGQNDFFAASTTPPSDSGFPQSVGGSIEPVPTPAPQANYVLIGASLALFGIYLAGDLIFSRYNIGFSRPEGVKLFKIIATGK